MPPARADLLARLPAAGFVPPEDAAPWSVEVRAAEFRAAVEAFAVAYWSLPPAKRGARYDRLSAAAYGPAAARLGLLESGLDATAADPGPTTHDRLVRELIATRRQARIAAAQTTRPFVVVFQEFVFDTLAGLGLVRRSRGRARVAAAQTTRPFFVVFKEFLSDMLAGLDLLRRSRRRGTRWSLKGFLADRVNQSLLVCSGVAAVAVIALLMSGVLFPGPPERTTFTPAEVQSYQAFRVAPRFRQLAGAPAGYADWLAAGMPAGRAP
ncbi:MAG: hypothetical protein U0804_04405 [Gemmataceae bacterium]